LIEQRVKEEGTTERRARFTFDGSEWEVVKSTEGQTVGASRV
jgi:hypothetical protein